MKKSKHLKFEIESTSGTAVDLSAYWKTATAYDKDGNIVAHYISSEYLKELEAKYEKVLSDIVKNHN